MGLPLIYRPSPLVYPGGAAGFDPSHPAATGTYLSAVPSGSNFVNLLTGAPGAITSTTTAQILGAFGPAVNFTASGSYVAFSGLQSSIYLTATLATFFTMVNTSTQVIMQSSNSANAGTMLLAIGGVLYCQQNDLSTSTGFTPTTNVPYFLAVSVSGTKGNVVVVNLLTGAVYSATVTLSAAIAINGTVLLGNYAGHSLALSGRLGPAMVSTAYLSMPTLLQWAQRPQDFWRPPTVTNLIFSSLRRSSVAGHKRSFGTFMGRP